MENEDLFTALANSNFEKFCDLYEPSDLEYEGWDGTCLNVAAEWGSLEIVRFLVESGADVNRRSGRRGLSAITVAAKYGNLEIVKYLKEEANAIIDTSHPSRNPLMGASGMGQTEIVKYLLAAGVDPHLTYRVPAGMLINAYSEAYTDEIAKILEDHGCRNPIEGKDKPVWEPSQGRMLNHAFGARDLDTPEAQRYREIIQYMEQRFGPVDEDGMQELVPIIEGMSVAINIIQPNDLHPFWVLFTNGMSDLPMNVPPGKEAWQYAELLIHLPVEWVHPRKARIDPQWIWPIKWLRTIAYQPHLNESWLGLPSTIVSSDEPPEPLGPNTEQSCLLLLPDLSNLNPPLQTGDRQIHFYTMVPIFTEERDFELNNGMDKFFDKFMNSQVSLTVDLNRPNFGVA